jgi:putative sterol carrier protein
MSKDIITAGLQKSLAKGTLGAVARVEFDDGSAVVITSLADRQDIDWDSAEKGSCQMACSVAIFVDMLEGRLAPPMAFMNGQLKINGDMGVAMKMAQLIG